MLQTYRFNEPIEIVNLGDVHYGHKNCDINGFNNIVDYIKKNKNVYWVSTGDLMEVNFKSNKTFDYGNLPLKEELDALYEQLTPIKDKCLGIVGSNHHKRLEKEVGLNLDALMCQLLGINYLGITGFLRVIVGDCGYFICMHHTNGFGKSRGAKANNAQRLSDVYRGYDIYMNGHTHCYQHFIDVYTILDRKHYKNMDVKTHFITTGHYLKYENSYAEEMLLTPAPRGSSIVHLGMNKTISVHFMEV